MIGDRMDTDIICGLEAGLRTILVLTGSTQAAPGRPVPVPPDPGRATRWPTSSTLVDELDPAR